MSDTTTPAVVKTDATIDSDWGSGSPDPAIAPDNFFVRWTGALTVATEADYTFTAIVDGGVRLWIDGVLVVDRWEEGLVPNISDLVDSDPIHLTAGSHAITLEYFDGVGSNAEIELQWSSVTVPDAVIPTSAMTPPPAGAHAPVLAWTGEADYTADGIHPQDGTTATTFTYRVKYTDADGDLPATGSPRVHVLDQGVEITGSPFAMTLVSGTPATGAIYTYPALLPVGVDYTQVFDAVDVTGLQAVGVLSLDGRTPVVAGDGPNVQDAPMAGDIDRSGRVDGFDLGKLAISYGSQSGGHHWNPLSDMQNDGAINGTDLDLLIDAFLN